MATKTRKHQFGQPNAIIQQEETRMLTVVDQALGSTSNSQTLGRNGEVPTRDFFQRYLPYMFRAATGHFITPSGHLSPQIDVLILDARYPLLSENADGSVLAMLHAVVATVEVKTRLRTADIKNAWSNADTLMTLASEVGYNYQETAGHVSTYVLAYRTAPRLAALESAFLKHGKPGRADLEVYLLRLAESDRPNGADVGANLCFVTPDYPDEYPSDEKVYELGWLHFHTPLSDLYYRMLHRAFAALHARESTYSNLAEHLGQYMTWSTFQPLVPRWSAG